MNLTLEGGVSIITVFIQGLLSFFSPCVFPLIPLYISYLAGGMHEIDKNGNIIYSKRKVAIHTLCFVIGISTAFFILGIGFTVIGQFFKGNRIWLSRLSGVIMILFGLYQLGIFGKSQVLEREHRLPFRIDKLTMNPITAWILGFTFSFAWTPCVGPTLSSVLLLAGSSESMMKGIILIGVYVLGFIIPFLMVGLFTGTLLSLFKKYGSVVKYTVRIAAILLILMGIMTLSGKLNGTSDYVASNDTINEEKVTEDPQEEDENEELVVAPDFILIDQFGNEHKLSDYEGKTVFLNFWATWCGPCQLQSPVVDEIAKEMGDQVKVCKVNVDEQASLALNYQITSIPTLVFMKYGLFQQRMIGLQNKETIMECLNTLLADE